MKIPASLPRIAYVVAFIMALLIIGGALTGLAPIILLPFALVPLLAGIGILRRRVWSAYGLGLYFLGQFLIAVLLLQRGGGTQPIIPTAILAVVLAVLFFLAGRSLASTGAERGWPIPWILLTALSTLPLVFVQAFVMPTGSMEDTLLIGDQFLVQRFPKITPTRDSVVVFVYPIDRQQTFVKRIVGIPGDHIRIAQKVLYRNGAALREPYVQHKTEYFDEYRDNFPGEPNVSLKAPAQEMLRNNVVNSEVVVPPGKYFVLGDNRDSSLDSRYWGFIDLGDVLGKPLLIYDSEEQSPVDVLNGNTLGVHRIRWSRFFNRL